MSSAIVQASVTYRPIPNKRSRELLGIALSGYHSPCSSVCGVSHIVECVDQLRIHLRDSTYTFPLAILGLTETRPGRHVLAVSGSGGYDNPSRF